MIKEKLKRYYNRSAKDIKVKLNLLSLNKNDILLLFYYLIIQ